MKRLASMLLSGVLLVAMALPAGAAVSHIHMTDEFTFAPDPIFVGMGETVEWDNVSQADHTATSDTGFFNTRNVPPTGKHRVAFPYGGSFPYHCIYHGSPGQGMHGKINVADQWLNTGTQHAGDVQRIRIATVTAPDGLAYDVQMKTTGGDWHAFKVKTTQAVVKFTPSDPGEYQFRSRVHRLSNNNVSKYSPPTFVEISE